MVSRMLSDTIPGLANTPRGELAPTEVELARTEGRPYESADDLLARIRRARAATATTPKHRRTRRHPTPAAK